MNKVLFRIKSLGAVKNSQLELKPFMVFSGESGLGKSYVAFLVHYLYMLLTSERLNLFFSDYGIDFSSLLTEKKKAGDVFLRIPAADLFAWINRDAITYIGYLIGNENFSGNVAIEFPYVGQFFDFTYDKEMVGLDNHEELFYKIELDDFTYRALSRSFQASPEPFAALTKAVLLDAIWGDHQKLKHCYLMPPSRGALMELTERPPFRSGMYEEFFDLKLDLSRPLSKPVEPNAVISECLSEVNRGNLQQVDGRIVYHTREGAAMPLTAAASSVKELAPFTMMLTKFSTKGVSVLFEEPEAHLHPDKQVKMADLIACAVNNGCHMQVTTHSDYFIKRMNNLIKLYLLKEKMEPGAFSDLLNKWEIKEDCLINPEDVGAFLLKGDGNGSSEIVTQDIATGNEIPFESFYQVIDEDIQLSAEIRKLLNN